MVLVLDRRDRRLDREPPPRELRDPPNEELASSASLGGARSFSQCALAYAPLGGRMGREDMSTSTRPTHVSSEARRSSTRIAPPRGSMAMNCRVDGPQHAWSVPECNAVAVVENWSPIVRRHLSSTISELSSSETSPASEVASSSSTRRSNPWGFDRETPRTLCTLTVTRETAGGTRTDAEGAMEVAPSRSRGGSAGGSASVAALPSSYRSEVVPIQATTESRPTARDLRALTDALSPSRRNDRPPPRGLSRSSPPSEKPPPGGIKDTT